MHRALRVARGVETENPFAPFLWYFRAGLDEAKARLLLLERHGIEIGGGLGAFAGKMWRIGCMGHTARPRNVSLLLAALSELLAA